MNLKDIFSPFSAWRNIVKEPVTIKDPLRDRPGAPRYRGFHRNDMEQCIGCGTCEMICENESIDMVPVKGIKTTYSDSGLRPLIDYGRCCWCALCVDICTTGSLTMSNEYTWVSEDPDDYRYIPGVDKKAWDDSTLGWRRPDGIHLYEPGRVMMEEVPGDDRRQSFIEIVKGYSHEQARQEADRCVACGLCTASCPAHMDIPAYIAAIREGDLEEGLRILYDTNPLPEICGRVCTHRCETVCSVGYHGDPLAIRWLKRYIADYVPFERYKEILGLDTLPEREKKIGVIGAGPSGLSVAYYLRTMGYSVTVFDAKEKGGGMTMYGIPKYRLPLEILDGEIGLLETMGITFRFNTMVGKDITFEDIYNDYDAVFMGIGFEHPYRLAIEGEDFSGSIQAINYLREVNEGHSHSLGTDVVIIGGGNVAMDAARVARRTGATVTILYRRRLVDMPADPEEIEGAEQEGVNIITQAIPIHILGKDQHVTGVSYLKAEMIDDEAGGRPKPIPIEGSDTIIKASTIIGAIGQGAAYEFIGEALLDQLKLERGRVVTDNHNKTSLPRLFAGGDAVNKTADAISAIADGHRAAIGIDKLLKEKQI